MIGVERQPRVTSAFGAGRLRRHDETTTRRHDETLVSLFEGFCPLASTALRAVQE